MSRMPVLREPSVAATGTNLRVFGALLWRRRLVMALVVALVAAVIAIGLALAERQFTATARVAVTPSPELSQTLVEYDTLLSTMADVAVNRPLLSQVSAAIGTRSLVQLQDRVQSAVVTGTVVVQVSVTDPDPQVAAQVANAVVAALPAFALDNGQFVFTVIDPAATPTDFTSPNIKISVLAGALLALALGVAAAVVRDRVSRTVDTPEEVAEATQGLGVLGVLPRPVDAGGVSATDPDSAEFAALRALRVALEFASSDQPTRTLVVAPAVAGPWSGWLEVNLAVSLAEVGHRVLVIDAHRGDRRRHPALDAPGKPGLYDMLATGVPVGEVALPGPVDGVAVVPLGNPDLAAPSLLEMRIRRLMEEIDPQYDVILVHAPPVTESDDARIIGIDGAVLITIPAGRVKRDVLVKAVADLRVVPIRTLGAVLLGTRRR
ncbi:Mrp family chromosome partitioning ATPase/capsular polysaccharide biosynthesis protein [Nocardioides daedukensis]|uniref:Mrp family chromosome partitioning ATPase/capsular polysaccharide biosynthesis protein n=1 Tax=Nocardioides daedukensis TaxID=634462 RepID=A0A7Y9S1T2_9ACTN|nr:hypothetical protein [Nocardioides daedukensis]NYG58548.1 Mrp family chromosome partitioning ATPase/capsular polysaccharide biosynthesis protein [Nocardioides daedukensis]